MYVYLYGKLMFFVDILWYL